MGDSTTRSDPTHLGRYRIEKCLGKGGIGVVYAARDPELDRRVAVKLLRPDRMLPDPSASAARLRQEAQAMAKLSHPNVVNVFDVGEYEEGLYIAMELVEGSSLRDWVDDTVRPWREVLGMYFQAGRGLAAAHDAGIIHRDFKPANVLVGRDGRARVLDFGLASPVNTHQGSSTAEGEDVVTTAATRPVIHRSQARVTEINTTEPPVAAVDGQQTTEVLRPVDRPISPQELPAVLSETLTLGPAGPDLPRILPLHATTMPGVTEVGSAPGVVVGTPAYMAPELFLGADADHRSDQFAFCVSLYESLYGQRPFGGVTTAAIAENVLAGNLQPPPARTRVPRWVGSIILKGLARKPEDRHDSIRSMLAAFVFLAHVVWD